MLDKIPLLLHFVAVHPQTCPCVQGTGTYSGNVDSDYWRCEIAIKPGAIIMPLSLSNYNMCAANKQLSQFRALKVLVPVTTLFLQAFKGSLEQTRPGL